MSTQSTQSTRTAERAGATSTTKAAAPADAQGSRISNLFDIRLIVGVLLTIYGVVLTIKGAFDSAGAIHKAAGIRLNLWTGIGLLAVGLFMLAWMKLRPLPPTTPDDLVEEQGPRESRA